MNQQNLNIIILAAGLGTRMKSSLPKVMHQLAGKPLLALVLNTANKLDPKNIYVVYGYGGDILREYFEDQPLITWVEQKERLGTGHAVQQVLPHLSPNEKVLVLYGDMPLISLSTLENLIQKTQDQVGWLTAFVENPQGLGRIIRDSQSQPLAIVEEKDANVSQKAVKEINTGVCLFPTTKLIEWLPNLKNNNAQNEYYITDLFAEAIENNISVVTTQPGSDLEMYGINDKQQLAFLERAYQKQLAEQYMKEGLTLRDPNRFDVRGELTFDAEVEIDINVLIEGKVVLGKGCHIGPNVVLKNATLKDYVTIQANTVIEDAVIYPYATLGPFARIRPGSVIKEKAKIGNFVETKKSEIGEGSKVSHLSYIGDTTIGKNVNVGAGTITCNYDGVYKHKTIIEDDAFIGSCTQLVAPVTVGKGATIGAGSTITINTPKDKLSLARARQVVIEGWERPKKIED